MRQLFVAATILTAVGLVRADVDGPVACKAEGLHLCCGTCEKSVNSILAKVDGVSKVKVDRKAADKVTFVAKSDKEANAALVALYAGGFSCDVSADGKKLPTPPHPVLNVKGDELSVTGVHVCCGQCVNAVTALFKDSKATVTVTGKGAIRTLKISGKNLDGQTVLNTMEKGGFTGKVEASK